MSKHRALEAINGHFTDRIPQWDFPDNPALAKQLFSYDIWKNPEKTAVDLWKYFDIDLAHYLPGDIAEWNFPLVRYYGDAEYDDDSRCRPYQQAYQKPTVKPYKSMYDQIHRTSKASFWGMGPTLSQNYDFPSPESVLAFDPLEYDSHTMKERECFFREYYRTKQAMLGDSCLLMGWYYHTLFMWPVEIFGWENFMLAAMQEPERFVDILNQFSQLTKRDITAMCQLEDLPLIACHDDLCSSNGPMFPPSWYEEYIFPFYRELFGVIHKAGKKVLFACDGNVLPLLDQIYETGPDGIAIDGQSDLGSVVKKFSGKIIIGGMNPAIVSQGTRTEIETMVRKTVTTIKDEPGYFFQCHGMNGDTSPDNVLYYQKCICHLGKR